MPKEKGEYFDLSTTESIVLNCLTKKRDITLLELAKRTGFTDRHLLDIIGDLKKPGIITVERVPIHPGKPVPFRNRYIVNEDFLCFRETFGFYLVGEYLGVLRAISDTHPGV